MTLEDLKKILESTGMPVTWYSWPEQQAPPLPYICYHSPDTDNFFADGVTYYVINMVAIELYSRNVDQAAEKKIEDALKAAGIAWQKHRIHLADERCWETTYDCEV